MQEETTSCESINKNRSLNRRLRTDQAIQRVTQQNVGKSDSSTREIERKRYAQRTYQPSETGWARRTIARLPEAPASCRHPEGLRRALPQRKPDGHPEHEKEPDVDDEVDEVLHDRVERARAEHLGRVPGT